MTRHTPPSQTTYDLAIIGGGINGVGIARDAAGRGLKVFLCERGDLAGGTSSASSKLIHGGLRYLEHFELHLVQEALRERDILLRTAPHIVHPLRFIMPLTEASRPYLMVRLGLMAYDHLFRSRYLPKHAPLDLAASPEGRILKDATARALSYSDCRTDDARLVVLSALDAAERGAHIAPRSEFVRAERGAEHWDLTVRDTATAGESHLRARALVNAAGPWVDIVNHALPVTDSTSRIHLVQGSHIVVPKLYDGAHAFTLQNSDGRILFVIPFERDFSLLGTTDREITGDPGRAAITKEEIIYICTAVNTYFRTHLTPQDVVWSYCGVRALYDERRTTAARLSREYKLKLDRAGGQAPLLTVYGGKLTTYRHLAERAVGKLARFFPAVGRPWTAATALPGGDLPGGDFSAFVRALEKKFPALSTALLCDLARRHGTRCRSLLEGVRSPADLGQAFGGGLFEREVIHFADQEWAQSAEDILWRRTKCGLHMSAADRDRLASYLGARVDAVH